MAKHSRLIVVLLLGGATGVALSSCGEREAREACEEWVQRVGESCPAIDIGPDECDDVKAKDRDRYECLAALEDVCDSSAWDDC